MQKDSQAVLAKIAARWICEGWHMGNDTIIDELHAPDFIDHDPSGRAPERKLYASFPDFKAEIKDLVVEAETGKIALRWSATGTHRKSYLGAPPTGKRIEFKGIEIIRIRGGKIVERWGEWDGIELLQQIGRFQPEI